MAFRTPPTTGTTRSAPLRCSPAAAPSCRRGSSRAASRLPISASRRRSATSTARGRCTLTWKVTNTSGASVPFSAFWSTDLYVAGSDQGVGALVSGPPRTLQGIAIDGTKAGLVELTRWSHWFEGGYWPSTAVDVDAGATYNDTFNPNSVDNGFGVQWNKTLAPGASTTIVLGFNASEPGGAPVPTVAPDITRSPVSGPSHSATFAFAAHAGDTATVGFECSIDGGLFNPCTSPETLSGIAPR